ncbi:MAG: GNAT family N-acetyltransferase, partial [Phycisphaeraceae bacterium]|nr:GNAT family N-acetyltransferase [Phycisphaeraceae bacterium]
AYLDQPHNGFWVAEIDGEVVGMIGVSVEDNHVAEIRRLRVQPDWQAAGSTVPATLIETTLAHCKHHGALKVVLDTRFERDAALDTFDRFGFQHTRTRNVQEKDLLEFYLDLYRQERRPQEQ